MTSTLTDAIAPEADEPAVEGRCMDCHGRVKIERMTIHLAKLFSEVLRGRGEQPITTGDVVRCDPCGAKWRHERARLSDGLQRDTERVFAGLVDLRASIVSGDKPEGMWEDALRAVPEVIRLGHREAFGRAKGEPPRNKRKGGGKGW